MNTKPKKPSVRTRLSRAQRQQDIIDAARRVFEKSGYENATIAEIADAVGVVEGTVLHYFKTKRALMVTVIEQFYSDIIGSMERGAVGISGARNRLRYIIHTHLAFLQGNATLCKVILNESRGTLPELSERLHELNKRYTSIVVDTVNDGKKTGEIADFASATLVRNVVFGSIEHYLWDHVAGDKQVVIEQVADNLTQLIYSGIQHQPENSAPEISQLISKLNKMIK